MSVRFSPREAVPCSTSFCFQPYWLPGLQRRSLVILCPTLYASLSWPLSSELLSILRRQKWHCNLVDSKVFQLLLHFSSCAQDCSAFLMLLLQIYAQASPSQRKNLPLWKETKPSGFSGLYGWNTLDQFGRYSHKAKWGQSWNKQKSCKVILGYRKRMPGLTNPLLLQIPSKWQEQKHNSVISNYTDNHTEPHNRKMLVLLVKTQTTKLHLEGGRATCCRIHYGETAL